MNDVWPNNVRGGVLLGILVVVLTCLLMGAVRHDPPSLPVAVLDPVDAMPLASNGRYQIVTWEAGGGYGAFILDTATGTTKVAYSSLKGPGGKHVNNLGKPFARME